MSDRIDVRMPDGTIVRNVPRGTSKADLERRYKESVLKRRTAEHPILGPITSAVAGVANGITLGLDDEIRAGLDSVNPFNPDSIWRGGSFSGNQKRQSARNRQLDRANPKSYLSGQVAGAVAPALMTGGGSVAAAAPKAATTAARIARVAKPTALAAAQGAAYGFGNTDGDIKTRFAAMPETALWSAGGDLLGRGLGMGLSRVVGGRNFTPAQKALMDEGVLLTPGMRGGRGARMVEDKVMGSIPGLSDVADLARGRSFSTLRRAAGNRVLSPIGKVADDLAPGDNFGNEFAGKLNEEVYNAYDEALSNLSLQGDDALKLRLNDILQASRGYLDDAEIGVVQNNVASLLGKLDKGPVTGQRLREVVQELRGNMAALAGTGKGQALRAINDVIEETLDAQNGATASTAYKKARESVSLLKRYEDAASRAGTQSGEFGPTQFKQAVTKRGYGTNNANIASGDAPMLDLANAATEVMRVNSANSGTVPRAVVTGGLLSAPAALGMVDPLMGGLLATQTLKYVPGIDELVQKIAQRPDWARKAGERISAYAPSLGLLGLGTGLGLSQ